MCDRQASTLAAMLWPLPLFSSRNQSTESDRVWLLSIGLFGFAATPWIELLCGLLSMCSEGRHKVKAESFRDEDRETRTQDGAYGRGGGARTTQPWEP